MRRSLEKVGATGFEPATYCSQSSRASQAAPRPVVKTLCYQPSRGPAIGGFGRAAMRPFSAGVAPDDWGSFSSTFFCGFAESGRPANPHCSQAIVVTYYGAMAECPRRSFATRPASAVQYRRAVAQSGSAFDWGSKGRRFESCRPDFVSLLSFSCRLRLTGP